MTQLELAVAVLVGIYWTSALVTALRSGNVRYRQPRHTRAEEPKTYCLTAAVHFWEWVSS